MNLPPRPTLLSVLLALCLTLGTSACTGDADSPDTPGESSAAPQATDGGASFAIETRTTLGKVVGRLEKQDRQRLPDAITEVVQRWFNAAYVGGDYPRSDFSDAYPGFTPGARDEARRDRVLMTNKGIGSRIEDVTPTHSRIWVDVLAVGKRPAGVTARFLLKFRTEGELTRRIRVKGRLLLTKQESGWRIFGYDVAKGGRA